MKLMLFTITIFIFSYAFSEKASLMGCEWEIPDRYLKKGDTVWMSESGEKSLILFKNELFDEKIISNRIENSVRGQKVSFSVVENGYELTVYSEYLKGDESVTLPSWVVIKNEPKKGVFYLSGMELEELIEFSKSCMPSLQ